MITDLMQAFTLLIAACEQNCYYSYMPSMELQRSYIMTQMKSCTVKLLNKTYEIKCPEGEEPNLLLAVQKLNNQIMINKKKSKQLDDFQTLLLAALDISHELILCKNKQAHQQHQVTQFINSLENKINKMVGGSEMVDRIPDLD